MELQTKYLFYNGSNELFVQEHGTEFMHMIFTKAQYKIENK